METIAHYGGGFNPPQVVHETAARAALARFGRVVLKPCGLRIGEKGKESLKDIAPLHRANMVHKAFRGMSGVTVDDSDLERTEFERTWDIEQRYRSLGQEAWHVVGTDWFMPPAGKTEPPILGWYRGRDLWNECRFAILPREGYPVDARHLPPNHAFLDPCPDVSSSTVRTRVFNREPFDDLVSPEIAAYIRRYGLYLGAPPVVRAPFRGPLVPMVIADEAKPEALALKRRIEAEMPGAEPNVLVVLGGDGLMMLAVREHASLRLPFVGLNFGHEGHFLNQVDGDPLAILMRDDLIVRQYPLLHVEWTDEDGKTHAELGVNDAWLERDGGQSAWLKLAVDGQTCIQQASGDGLLVSTPQGSTGYAYKAGATPLFDHPGLVVAGLHIERDWKSTHESADAVITIEASNTAKRPVRILIDSVVKGRALSMTVRASRIAGAEFVFTPEDDRRKCKRYKYPR